MCFAHAGAAQNAGWLGLAWRLVAQARLRAARLDSTPRSASRRAAPRLGAAQLGSARGGVVQALLGALCSCSLVFRRASRAQLDHN